MQISEEEQSDMSSVLLGKRKVNNNSDKEINEKKIKIEKKDVESINYVQNTLYTY